MLIQIILILSFLLSLNIYSADLPEQEKKTLVEGAQKDLDDLTKEEEHDKLKEAITKLIKPGTKFYLDPRPEEIDDIKESISDFQNDIIFDVDHLHIGSVKNIHQIVNDSIPVIIYTATTAHGDLSCAFYTKINNYSCTLKSGNKIYRAKNGKQDFETIQRMYERQKAQYAVLYQFVKDESSIELNATGPFIPMGWNIDQFQKL